MSNTDRVWELMKKIGICMLASCDGQELQARPMGAYVRPNEHAVFFLADARHHKDEDISKYRKVCLAFSDTGAQNYVSVAGDAEVLDDRSMIRELWGIPAKAWWNSPDDPNIRLRK
jgi:general stress protein 26